jgi:hypothetical protein
VAANAEKKQHGRPFQKGQSGNPGGKAKGTRHRVTILAEKLMQDDAEEIVNVVVNAAKRGDLQAAQMILSRLVPPRRDSAVNFPLPAIKTAGDASAALSAILRAVANGELTPGEAGDVAKLLDAFTKTLEVCELEKRIVALETQRTLQ